MENTFRRAFFGGFNRQDVTEYISKMARENSEQLERLEQENVNLRTQLEDPAQADVVFLGSWTDRGSCAEPVREIAARLHHKRVFLFGTCGFGGSQTYYDQIFQRTAALLPPDNVVIGRFYCQGKMPEVVKKALSGRSPAGPRKLTGQGGA